MEIHGLKTWPEQFSAILEGKKKFEFRRNDRSYRVGNILTLREWDPISQEYTGRRIHAQVTYILAKGFGLPEGYCVMSIDVLSATGL